MNIQDRIEFLKRFCATPENDDRAFLYQPFTQAGFSYAGDGFILIRCERIEGIPEQKEPPATQVWAKLPPFVDMVELQVQEFFIIESPEYPKEPAYLPAVVDVFEGRYLSRYIHLIHDLPALRVRHIQELNVLLFACDGGYQGFIMGRKP